MKIDNKIYINFDKIVKWLNTRKNDLKETLVFSYVENIDYIIKKGKSTGGRPAEIIMITPNCFKNICLLSRTEKAKEIRKYILSKV